MANAILKSEKQAQPPKVAMWVTLLSLLFALSLCVSLGEIGLSLQVAASATVAAFCLAFLIGFNVCAVFDQTLILTNIERHLDRSDELERCYELLNKSQNLVEKLERRLYDSADKQER